MQRTEYSTEFEGFEVQYNLPWFPAGNEVSWMMTKESVIESVGLFINDQWDNIPKQWIDRGRHLLKLSQQFSLLEPS